MIPFTYEIINVDPAAKAMEIVYSSPGRQTMHIGARMPYVGESLEAVVQMFSPVAYWLEQEAQVIPVEQGTTGSFEPPAPPADPLKAAKDAKLAEIAAWRYGREVAGVTFNGASIRTDRESQATLASAYASLKNGLIASINWKTAEGAFVALGLAEIEAVAAVVAQHVQSCFDAEMELVSQVQAAQTVEAVNAVVVL